MPATGWQGPVAERPRPGSRGSKGSLRPRRGSLRLRITLAATAIVGITLLGGSAVYVVVQRAVLAQGVRAEAVSDADRVLARLESGATPAAAVAGLGERDGAVTAVLSADGSRILGVSGDPVAVRAYETLAEPARSGTVSLSGENYAIETSSGSDQSTPAPTVTITPPSDDSTRSTEPTPGSGGGGSSTDDSGGGGSDDSRGSGGGSSGSGGSSGGSGGGGSGGGSGGGGSDDVGAPAPGRGQPTLTAARPTPTPGSSSSSSSPSSSSSTAASDGGAGADVDFVVVAGRSLAAAAVSERATVTTLGIVIPVLLLVMAATTWFVVGRSLRPVERMRREVEGITAARLATRIPGPGGDDEIARLASTLNEMLDRLDDSARAQRRFVSDASHELRSPLAVMRQLAEVAQAYPGRIETELLADTVLTEGQRLADLVQGMLILARADEGGLEPSMHPVDVDDIVLAEAARLRKAGLVTVDATGIAPVRVDGDRGMLGQVVRNLADNAARHATSTVALSLAEVDGQLVLTVDDDGSGVADADRERIFARFVRLDEARARESGGSGLGLAIVRSLVAAHGGVVAVSGSPLGGARFTVTLPVHAAVPAGAPGPAPAPAPAPTG